MKRKYHIYMLVGLILLSCGSEVVAQGSQTSASNTLRITKKSSSTAIQSGTIIRKGRFTSGDIAYNIDGKYIRYGRFRSGDIAYNFDDKYIRKGRFTSGDIAYNIDGKYIRKGRFISGDVVYNLD